jgi:hypothetical protein
MQLILGNWANFQLQVSLATENQLHKIVAKWQISSSVLNHFFIDFFEKPRLKTILEFGGVLGIVGKPSPNLI